MTAFPTSMPRLAELTVCYLSPGAAGNLRSVLSTPRVLPYSFVFSNLSRGICDSSSVGRALASQARGREFETRLSLQAMPEAVRRQLKQNSMKHLLEVLTEVEDWVAQRDGRAIIISAVDSNDIDPITKKPNPDNFLYVKGRKADVNAALSHLVKSFK